MHVEIASDSGSSNQTMPCSCYPLAPWLQFYFQVSLAINSMSCALVSGRPVGGGSETVEKVLISSFMTVLVFFLRAIDDKPGLQADNPVTAEKTARALDSLACVEFCRRVQLQDYASLVERCVSYLSGHPSAAKIFVGFIPPYNNVVSWPGTFS